MIPHAPQRQPAKRAFELRTLGGLKLSREEVELVSVLTQPKRVALLCRLALAQGFVRRDLLLPLFWPESDDAHARAALRQAIHFLRQSLGENALISRGDEEIKVNEDLIWCDAVAFEQAIAEARLEEAFAMYQGDFLPGFFVPGAAEFDQWLDGERDRLRRRAVANAWSLAEQAAQAGAAERAAEYGQAAVSLTPTDDALLRRFMLLMERIGDPAGALRAYESYVRRLHVEYEMQPAAEVQQLARDITARHPPGNGVDDTLLHSSPRPLAGNGASIKWPRWAQALVPAGLLLSGTFYVVSKATSSAVDGGNGIVLADFVNHTQDPALANGITQALGIDLAQSRHIRVADNQRIGDVLRRMGRNRVPALTNELAREVAVREGLSAVLQGDVVELGNGYVINTQLVTADSGRVLLSDQAKAPRPADVIAAVDRLSERLRRHMGEKLHALHANQPLAAVTTSSLDALKAYSAAMVINRQQSWNGRADASGPNAGVADKLMERAIELDSSFASAYRAYGVSLYWQGRRARANEMLTRAFQLRQRLTEQERLLTEGTYYVFVREDIDNAIARFEQLLQINPRHQAALQQLALLYAGRDLTRATYYADREWALRGGAPNNAYLALLVASGRVARADSFLRYYAPRETSAGHFNTQLIRLEQTRQNYPAVDTLIDRFQILAQRSSPAARKDALRLVGSYRIWRGSYAEGTALFRESFDTTDAAARLTLAFNLARYDVFVLHDPAAARRRLDAALRSTPMASVRPADRSYANFAMAYAYAGDYRQALTLLQQHEANKAPLTTGDVKHTTLYNTKALIEASQGHVERARQIMAQGEREIGCQATAPWLRLGRAMVEELAGSADSTIAAWERFVAVPSCLASTSFDGAYASAMAMAHAHERLAQLYDARGDRERAVEHYRRFIEIWPHPDERLQPRWLAARRRLLALSAGNS